MNSDNLKLFAVVFSTESGDHHYEEFKATRQPPDEQIIEEFSNDFGESTDDVYIDCCWELCPNHMKEIEVDDV